MLLLLIQLHVFKLMYLKGLVLVFLVTALQHQDRSALFIVLFLRIGFQNKLPVFHRGVFVIIKRCKSP